MAIIRGDTSVRTRLDRLDSGRTAGPMNSAKAGEGRVEAVARTDDTPASRYLQDNFAPEDRVAVVALNRRSGAVVQLIGRAESITRADSAGWLKYMNDSGYEIYISRNAMKADAHGRTREDVGEIRHIYLDLDHGGQETLDRLLARTDLPKPNYVLTTSPGKYQVIWKVENFTHEQAETLQRKLAREVGADPAATDVSRVLRVPGFKNLKYEEAPKVESRKLSDQVNHPGDFPSYPETDRRQEQVYHARAAVQPQQRLAPGHLSQSEKDWAYAMRALARGESCESVVSAIAAYRQNDKRDPIRYAQRTVEKASRKRVTQHRAAPGVDHTRDR